MDQAPNSPLKPISVWLPAQLVAQLDAMLAAKVAHVPGARVSRHGWIARAIRTALDAAQTPVQP